MKKKNGFIATSLIYSFFLVFITLFLTIIADYLQNKVLLNTIESDIKEDINNSIYITDFVDGSDIIIQWDPASNVKCGNELEESSLTLANCKSIDASIQYKVVEKITYNSSKTNTLVLENQTNFKQLYIVIENVKFSILKDSGMTITGVK